MFHYQCDQCGACCQGHFIVEADLLDLLREPKLATADIQGWGEDLTDWQRIVALETDDKCLVLAAGVCCSFLGPDNRCVIYPTRPNVCVGMQAGDMQCQEARRSQGLPLLVPVDYDAT